MQGHLNKSHGLKESHLFFLWTQTLTPTENMGLETEQPSFVSVLKASQTSFEMSFEQNLAFVKFHTQIGWWSPTIAAPLSNPLVTHAWDHSSLCSWGHP